MNLIVTGKEGQARTVTEKLEEATDAIVIAGGDGTLSEVWMLFLRICYNSFAYCQILYFSIFSLSRQLQAF